MTSLNVRKAVEGDAESLEWVVRRLSPLLLTHAAYRVRALDGAIDAEDIVQETWLKTLPRLDDLRPRDGRLTPVLLKFMTTIVNRRAKDLLQKMARGRAVRLDDGHAAETPGEHSGVVSHAIRDETRSAVWTALQRLTPTDREVVILRGIEQSPLEAVATSLCSTAEAVRKRYHRALVQLRTLLPESVFAELPDGS